MRRPIVSLLLGLYGVAAMNTAALAQGNPGLVFAPGQLSGMPAAQQKSTTDCFAAILDGYAAYNKMRQPK